MRPRNQALRRLRSSPFYGEANPFREIREAFDINQAVAAELSGVSRTLWLAWEGQRRPIGVHQLAAVVVAFDLGREEVRWIVEWWGDARASPLTIAQLNVLKTDLPEQDLDVVDLLARVYSLPPF